jgi:hypothetical protein
MVHLVEHYSNPSSTLQAVLDAFPDGVPKQQGRSKPIAEVSKSDRLGNGVAKRAVIKVLVEASCPMSTVQVHEAVEGLLGISVSKDSVNSCLSTGSRGKEARFERVGRGWYRLANAWSK